MHSTLDRAESGVAQRAASTSHTDGPYDLTGWTSWRRIEYMATSLVAQRPRLRACGGRRHRARTASPVKPCRHRENQGHRSTIAASSRSPRLINFATIMLYRRYEVKRQVGP